MEPFSILLFVGIAWLVFATIQDLKTREVANWLTFSLIAVALAFRAFLSVQTGEIAYVLWGVVGGAVFVGCAYAFYYGRVFAGGDAKLLMGIGIALPYRTGEELVLFGSVFLFALFFAGAMYTLAYSLGLVMRARRTFARTFVRQFRAQRWLVGFSFVLALVLLGAGGMAAPEVRALHVLGSGVLAFIPLLYVYLQSVEQACMLRAREPWELREGDWLVGDVRRGRRTVRAGVHGLSHAEIAFLRRFRAPVMIKEGVPFVPAFLLAYGIMVFAAATGGLDWPRLSSALSSLVPAF